MGNSKYDPDFLNEKQVFYSADLNFFRGSFFQKSIESGEIPILVDPSSVDYWQNKFQAPIITTDDIASSEPSSQKSKIKKLSSLGNFKCGFATSGSTGDAKIFLKTQDELNAELQFLTKFLEPYSIQSMTNSIPLCHIYGFLWSYALPLELGVEVIDANSLALLRNSLLHSNSDFLVSVPSLLQAIQSLVPELKTRNLRTIVSSGSRMRTEFAQDLESKWGVKVLEIYGSTETGGMGYRYPSLKEDIQFFSCVKARIIDEVLSIKSPFVHPTLVSEDGLFATSDIGIIQDNRFHYQGRKDRIIKVNGKRIHLDSLEQDYISLFDEFEILLTEYYSEENSSQMGLLVQLRMKDSAVSSSNSILLELIEAKLSDFPNHMQPNRIKFIDELPLLPNGKKDYRKASREFNL